MPVISTRRYSTATGSSSFLPPSVGGTTSSLSTGYGSSYRSSSLSNSTYTTSSSGYTSSSGLYLPRTSSYRTGLYNSSSSLGGTTTSYRHSTYLSGGNNDTTATSRLGVSNNRYSRSSSDRDTKRITGKTQYNNNINTITSNRTTKTLQTKPPIAGSLSSSRRLSESRIANDQVSSKSDQNYNYNNNSNCNNALSNNINNCNSNQYQSKFTSSTAGQEQSDNNNTTKISSSLSSSSLARQVATSGLEFYEKYSPAHYIPKCELSRSRSLSEATPSKLHNNDNNLSNSSNNVHQLLPQKEVLSNDRDNKSPSATSATATSTTTTTATTASRSSPSSNKDISTTQLASKVKNLFAAATNTATNNYFDNNLNASSIVVLNNNNINNIHNQKLFINNYNQEADANNIPIKYPLLQANNSSEADNCLSDLTKNYIPPSSGIATTTTTTITATTCSPNKSSISSTVVTSQKNSKSFSVVDIVNSTNSNNNTIKNHCKHDCTISSHLKEQSIQTCSNCNKTTATVIASSQTSSHQPQLLQQQLQQNQQQIQKLSQQPPVVNINTSIDRKSTSSITASGSIAATIININTEADEAFVNNNNNHNNNKNNSSQGNNIDKLTTKVTPQSSKINLKATKELLSNKFDDSKIMSNNLFLIKNLRNNNNTNTNNPVTVTYHTTTTTVTIQSPSIVTAVAAASNITTTSAAITTTSTTTTKPIKHFNKSNLLDFRLDFYKNKRLSGGGTTATAIAGGQHQNTTQGIPQQPTISNSSPNKTTTNKTGNSQNFGQSLISTFKDQNFLKSECEIARSQVVKKKNLEDNTKSQKHISIIEEKINNINNNKSNSNNNNSSTLNGSIEKLNKFNSKNIIKPLVHKTTNNKLTSRLAKIITNNNMNCLQNSPELLDDIKYIDSDENDRQQQQQHQKQQANKINTSLPSSSSSQPPVNTLTAASFKSNSKIVNCTNNLIPSTLPLTSKQRDLINSDSSSKATVTNKFNTLNDFKRIPSSVRNINSSYTATTATNIVNINDNKLLLSSSSSSSSSSPVSKNHATISNLPKTSVAIINDRNSTSRGSTPPSSPQLLRRNNIPNSNSNLSHPQHQQQQQHATVESSSSLSSSSSILNDKKLSNKLCDIDESVRNASIRSALPPSPTPSRYWDREGRSSSTGVGSRNTHESDDYTSSSKSSDSYDKGSTEGLCGLRNIGNTCFMNSVIQCLSHTRELTKFLKTQMASKASSKDQLILYEFAKLIREMWSPNVRSVTPLELKSAFSTKHRMYSGYNQQDAQEFLRFFLDSLHSALNNGSKGDPLKIDDSLSDNKKADLTWEWYSRVENSVIRDLFVGQLKSALRCTTCGNESVTFDPFWDLSVPLPSNSRCKLDSCLELFIREEVLDGDEMPTCSKCQTRRKCTKTFTIQRFPRYLVIHLKRFSETRWSKLSNIVEFPTGERELNMSPYAANSSTNVLYSLYAISNHMGSTAGGHYVALCKHPSTKKWHEFNDNVVSDGLSESALVSSSAYLLFYERA